MSNLFTRMNLTTTLLRSLRMNSNFRLRRKAVEDYRIGGFQCRTRAAR